MSLHTLLNTPPAQPLTPPSTKQQLGSEGTNALSATHEREWKRTPPYCIIAEVTMFTAVEF